MSGENFLIDYTAYMRSLAEKHKKLQHSKSNKHFFRENCKSSLRTCAVW